MLKSHPDCWSTSTWLARLSSSGELLWIKYLVTNNLLGLPGNSGEVYHMVSSVRETAEGDILASGSVAQWITSQDAMFVCLLDGEGETGETLWSTFTFHFGISEASAIDAVETSANMVVAVGCTAESRSPEGNDSDYPWGQRYPNRPLSFKPISCGILTLRSTVSGEELLLPRIRNSPSRAFVSNTLARTSVEGRSSARTFIRFPEPSIRTIMGSCSLRVGDEEFSTDKSGILCRLGEVWR